MPARSSLGETGLHLQCSGGGSPGIGYADLQGGSLDAPTKIPDHPLELAAFRLLCASKRMERSGREEVAKRCRDLAAQLVARVHAKPEGEVEVPGGNIRGARIYGPGGR